MNAPREMMHPDPEELSAFAAGRMDGSAAAAVVEHLDRCEDCMSEVALAMSAAREEAAPRRSWAPWIMAIAAAVAIAIAVPAFRAVLLSRGPSIDRLVALAPKSTRVVEPRLTGGFGWAAYAGPARAGEPVTDAERMKLTGAAGELVERANRERDPAAQHAAGVAMVLVEAPLDGIARLEAAAAASRDDARVWSDLAAARYAAASQLGRASLYPSALAAADAALRVDPKLPEALFNRALILDRLGLAGEARRAWERFLEVDASSPWAAEARARLADLPVPRASTFERERPLLEAAASRGDAAAVRRHVDAHRDRARAWAEGEYLGRWAAAMQASDRAEAVRWLSTARAIGDALAELSGESLPRDATRAIDAASPAELPRMAEGHLAYRSGRIAYSRQDLDTARRELLRAAAAFEASRHPMALSARYYGAGVRLARSETAAARAELERLREELTARPTFISLAAHVRWELGRARMIDDDFAGAVPVLSEGAALFRRAGDLGGAAFVESLLTRALAMSGSADEAWLARMRVFASLSAEGEHALLLTAVDTAMHSELVAGRIEAALALSAIELGLAHAANDHAVIDALLNHAMLQASAGDATGALASAREAERRVRAIADPALQARRAADAAAAMGAALARSDPRAARESLTRAVDFYRAHAMPFALAEPLLLRARGAARAGDAASAMRDLDEGIALVERKTIRTGVLDAEHALFADAIRLSLDRGDRAAAFAYAERARGGSVTLADLQQRLAGSAVAVLHLAVLPEEVVSFAVSARDLVVARRRHSAESLAALGAASLDEEGAAAASALYEELIRPVDAVIARASELLIVPDPRLQTVPFAALYDASGRRHLIDRLAVSLAANATSLARETPRRGAPALTAIALPSADLAALPESTREVGEVAVGYARVDTIPSAAATLAALRGAASRADVLHIAGHTERQRGGGAPVLVLAGSERASSKTIVASPNVNARVVVLAACETLRPPGSAATRSLSLAAAFAAAGAREVVGTLAPIGDRDARLLFRALHQRIAAGARPSVALREVQQEAIAAGGRRSWRSVAVLTRTIALD